ncbi:ubiquitin-specific protease [Stylosanthes scabra]|uniref:Ubiquitin-specific protease n=1 Tax=Stylosanthes scabra TaxID=79078 RepID=A0ABU6TK26_9FABA|nr:ubiquitin-specific protease [Stylosanthes scabra]
MRITVDLGFSPSLVLVLLICFAVPVIGLVVRHKWRLSVARSEEVRRLLVLAAEEAARAESEATYQYFGEATVPVAAAAAPAKSNQCAVCFCPTTTRCSRCKAVHYCSGKCQIVHWRQGHKDECCPPCKTNDWVSDLGKKVAVPHEVHDEKSKIDNLGHKTSTEEPLLSEASLSPESSYRKDDNRRVESLGEGNITDSTFSGFSASNSASESSDDSSVCESISNEHDRVEGHIFVEPTLENSDSIETENRKGVSTSLSPKFASLVDAADGFSSMSKLNRVRPGFNKEESNHTTTGSLGLNMGKGPTIESPTVSSGFWDKTLDSRVIKDDTNSGPLPPHFDDAPPKSSGKETSCVGLASSDNEGMGSSGFSRDSSIQNLQSVGSKVSNHVVNKPDNNLKSAEIKYQPHALDGTMLVSKAKGHSQYDMKSGRNGIQSGTATSSQAVNCSRNSKNGSKTSILKVVDQCKGANLTKNFPLSVGSDIARRYSDQVLFLYDLFVKLYNWNRVELQPFGLINCGNSCYANAVLQCLAFTPPLTSYLLQGLHSKSCANKKLCFACELESLILKSKETESALSPVGVLSKLQSIGSQLGNGKEEDAHEFLRHTIEAMQSVFLMESELTSLDSLKEETNLMGLTFGGYLRSKIQCMECGGKSEQGDIASLEEALRRFTSTETLDGENKYNCVRCKSYEKAKKKLTVSEAPNVLTIVLKRFQSGKFGKLNKPIQFPEILNFAPFMSGTSDRSPIYRLYGVVVHLDIMNAAYSGHYVCYVKNFQNKWFKVDDSVVTAVDLDKVLTEGAYMLFYARCSPRAPKLIRSRISSDSKLKVHGKAFTMKSRHVPSDLGGSEHMTSRDGAGTLDPLYSKFYHIRRVLEEDMSDNSSLFSSNSDEGSCSTDSTHDSTSNDDFAEYIFRDSGRGNVLRNHDSDHYSSASSSPLNSRLPLSDMGPHDSVLPDVQRPPPASPRIEKDGLLYRGRPLDLERREGVFLLNPEYTSVEHRKLDKTRSSSSFREADITNVGTNRCNDVSSGVTCTKSRERTD